MASIQDSQQHYQVKDWPKLSGVWLLEIFNLNIGQTYIHWKTLQISVFNGVATAAMAAI